MDIIPSLYFVTVKEPTTRYFYHNGQGSGVSTRDTSSWLILENERSIVVISMIWCITQTNLSYNLLRGKGETQLLDL